MAASYINAREVLVALNQANLDILQVWEKDGLPIFN